VKKILGKHRTRAHRRGGKNPRTFPMRLQERRGGNSSHLESKEEDPARVGKDRNSLSPHDRGKKGKKKGRGTRRRYFLLCCLVVVCSARGSGLESNTRVLPAWWKWKGKGGGREKTCASLFLLEHRAEKLGRLNGTRSRKPIEGKEGKKEIEKTMSGQHPECTILLLFPRCGERESGWSKAFMT